MGTKTRISLILCLLLFSIISVSASDNNQSSDALSSAFAWGLKGFMYMIGDSIYGLVGDVTDRSKTDTMITELLAYNVDPYSIKQVRDWQDLCAVAFVVIGMGILMFAFIFMRLDVRALDEIIGDGYTQNRLVDALLILLAVPLLSTFGVWVILKLNYVVSTIVSNYMLMAIPQTSDNFILYIFMALEFVLLSIVMFVRAIIIMIFVAVSIVIGTMYSVTEYRQTVIDYVYAFLKIVFLQPRLLLYCALGIVVIENLPPILQTVKSLAYLGLIVFVVKTGYDAVFGSMITTAAKIIIFKKVK
jgi:hypothetical protein